MYTGRCPLGWNIYLWSLRFVFGKHLNGVPFSFSLSLLSTSLSASVWEATRSAFPTFDRANVALRPRTTSIILALLDELKRYASPRVVHFVLVSHRKQETFFTAVIYHGKPFPPHIIERSDWCFFRFLCLIGGSRILMQLQGILI